MARTVIRTLLIANRGEMACRIARTAKRLSIKTVAVYTETDKNALHRYAADSSVLLDSYLNAAQVIQSAISTGCDAVHPGCGFLSENAEFAGQCSEAGLLFIGPSPAAMQAAASKATAKQLAQSAGIPTVPGFDNRAAGDTALQNAADKIGYPVLIKAAAGGGGRGMRVVERADLFAAALAAARREAKAGFNDDTVILEKYVRRARHVEVQLIADRHGNARALGERDCSLQRRHQKLLEEAPAPNMSADCRTRLHDMAEKLARAMCYDHIGTVEFLLDEDGEKLYFLEVNARLQVEHPVTEMIFKTDLVEWQLRLAAGETLPLDGWQAHGAAMEARICAEDPLNDFLPATGALRDCRFPTADNAADETVRIESGIAAGDIVSEQYDSLLAKIIVAGDTREAARTALRRALEHTSLPGVANNIALIHHLTGTAAFADAAMWTTMIEEQRLQWTDAIKRQQDTLAVCAVLSFLYPPTALYPCAGFRINDAPETTLTLMADERIIYRVEARLNNRAGAHVRIQRDKEEATLHLVDGIRNDGEAQAAALSAHFDGHTHTARVETKDGERRRLSGGGVTMEFALAPLSGGDSLAVEGAPIAPMNAVVSHIAVAVGAQVEKGTTLLTLEAMKMEINVPAASSGVVTKIHCQVGDLVTAGTVLADIETPEAEAP